jgi:hypothetical protein
MIQSAYILCLSNVLHLGVLALRRRRARRVVAESVARDIFQRRVARDGHEDIQVLAHRQPRRPGPARVRDSPQAATS